MKSSVQFLGWGVLLGFFPVEILSSEFKIVSGRLAISSLPAIGLELYTIGLITDIII